ncbi:helix-turn-helix transcriptional regulator [uncultured Marinobacter sp.]|uniref:helix-turn-helix domain-containing protein n=1 Tax=uncultured Marinobacter sp. TaxID=187379 RepID=UPI0025F96B48|nr:helix-turn-helix transcriptional regulator [uncultured Marinobacter sp.]
MPGKNSDYELLANVIESIQTSRFTSNLTAFLHQTTTFDSAVILGHRSGKHPIYLHDSLQEKRHLLFNHYLTHAYLGDPFYLQLIEKKQQGVFLFKDVASGVIPSAEYQRSFYKKTGWQDEICLTIQLEADRWIVIYLGFLESGQRFSRKQVEALLQRFDVIAALCRQHWNTHPFHLGQPYADSGSSGSNILSAVASFGGDRLSPREQQVLSLILQGLDTRELSENLGITEGTVKNHRKSIYAQLHVTSLGELFRLFLNYAITSPDNN